MTSREVFENKTGINWQNQQGEPDIDYVYFLEEQRDLMLEVLKSNYETYEVQKEIFEQKAPNIWQMLLGSWLQTPEETKDIIKQVSGGQ